MMNIVFQHSSQSMCAFCSQNKPKHQSTSSYQLHRHSLQTATTTYCRNIQTPAANVSNNCASFNCALLLYQIKKDEKDIHNCQVSKYQLQTLHAHLTDYLMRVRSFKENQKSVYWLGKNFEFTEFQVTQVIKNCQYIFTIEDVFANVEIWWYMHAKNVLAILSLVFEGLQLKMKPFALTWKV